LPSVPHAYDVLRDRRQYRLVVSGVHATDLRRYGLSSPQGFDPLLPSQFKALIEQHQSFRTNRLFEVQPADTALLRLLGVGYFLTRTGDAFPAVPPTGDFRLIGRADTAFQVYEYVNAVPSWRWEGPGAAGATRWEPELREFTLPAGRASGRFVLIEQFYPGWRASIDGRPVPIERWNGAFQSVAVPAGSHSIRFQYRPASVMVGAAISAASLLALLTSLIVLRLKTTGG
jgi:hypothetical protein